MKLKHEIISIASIFILTAISMQVFNKPSIESAEAQEIKPSLNENGVEQIAIVVSHSNDLFFRTGTSTFYKGQKVAEQDWQSAFSNEIASRLEPKYTVKVYDGASIREAKGAKHDLLLSFHLDGSNDPNYKGWFIDSSADNKQEYDHQSVFVNEFKKFYQPPIEYGNHSNPNSQYFFGFDHTIAKAEIIIEYGVMQKDYEWIAQNDAYMKKSTIQAIDSYMGHIRDWNTMRKKVTPVIKTTKLAKTNYTKVELVKHSAQQNEVIQYAWQISHDPMFLYTLKGENGEISVNRLHDDTYGWGFCGTDTRWQFNRLVQGSIVPVPQMSSDAERRNWIKANQSNLPYFTDWKLQIRECYSMYKGGTPFWAKERLINTPNSKWSGAVKSSFKFS